jgi:predicted AAA+ superfamily ATPase
MVADPELFYRNLEKNVVVFDEVHQLPDPSKVLKVGADLFPHIKILATGSSTLAASKRFKDTLTGRKRMVHLTPVLWNELPSFGASLFKRLYHGGLPETLLSEKKPIGFYREWMDSFFARDIQRLFSFRAPDKFIKLFEYLMQQSGGLLEVTKVSREVGISRPTVESHLRALQATHALTLIRPFHRGGHKEIVKMPKAYGFDTGFVSFCRGWDPLRSDDLGPLWEHVALETMMAHLYESTIHYWRDASGREIDFVVIRDRDEIDVIECKWNPDNFDPNALKVFRSYYPGGNNYILCPISTEGYPKRASGVEVYVCNPESFLQHMRRES